MPTDFPDLTTEFVSRYNKQQRELQSLRRSPPSSNDSEVGELRRQLEEVRWKQAEEKRAMDAEVARLRGELTDSKTARLAAEEAVRTLKEQEQAKLKEGEAEIKRLKKTIDELEQSIEDLKQKHASTSPESTEPQLPSNPAELARKLKEVREKISTCSKRLGDRRSFELSVSSQLSPEQLRELVKALSKELAGMTERYQALSFWEKEEQRKTANNEKP